MRPSSSSSSSVHDSEIRSLIHANYHNLAAVRNATGEIKFHPPNGQLWSDYLSQFSIVGRDLESLHAAMKQGDYEHLSQNTLFKPLVKDFAPGFFLRTIPTPDEKEAEDKLEETLRNASADKLKEILPPDTANASARDLEKRIQKFNQMCLDLDKLS